MTNVALAKLLVPDIGNEKLSRHVQWHIIRGLSISAILVRGFFHTKVTY